MAIPAVRPAQFIVDELSPSYWKVTFENGPVNLIDCDSIEQFACLVARIEESPVLTVVVFDSANPDYFMAHWDLRADRARVAAMAPGPTGLHPYLDNLVRLSKVPAVTISAIRGRVRGAGSEFVLATDIRFAGDKAILGHPEVGLGSVPGGGGMARLARLVGRGRAAEILLGADDVSAELAERYGYVNRVLPDAGLDGFVDMFARRIAGFDKVAVAGTKALLDWASLPPDEEFDPGLAAFLGTSGRPENAARIRYLFENGLQTPVGVELDLGRAVGEFASSLNVARSFPGGLRFGQGDDAAPVDRRRDRPGSMRARPDRRPSTVPPPGLLPAPRARGTGQYVSRARAAASRRDR